MCVLSPPEADPEGVPCIGRNNQMTHSVYAPSFTLRKLACGWYGVGHTNRRHPGDMRGTVVGKKGRFRPSPRTEKVTFIA